MSIVYNGFRKKKMHGVNNLEIVESEGYGMRKRLIGIFTFIVILTGIVILLPKGTRAEAAVKISAKVLHMAKGQTYKLKLTNAKSTKKVTWSSSDSSVASVKKGRVTANKEGMAVITAKYGKKVYECSVSVSGGTEDSLIIYFSATGTTGDAAAKIQEAVGADIVRLVPKTDYSSADLKYTDNSCRANKEQAENTMPAISTVIRNIDQYNTIYIGYPIWHGKEPGVIRTFLSKYSMEGKTVLPFCTSGSSGISGSMLHIRDMAEGADVKNGKDLTHSSVKDIEEWIKKENEISVKSDDGGYTVREMKMKIGNKEVDVIWEDNESVKALRELVGSETISINMSMYGGFEQVGEIGTSLPRNDAQTTTSCGDIVLYSGDKLVVFYGSNSWSYTRLGKITGLDRAQLTELLSEGDVTITIW